ncbi:unnamed protein product, partial [Discosporangium mesarthrocarpum]
VAVKEFRYHRSEAPVAVLQDLREEVCMHLRLRGHRRLVRLIGVWLIPKASLVLEDMECGSLHRLIHSPMGMRVGIPSSGVLQLLAQATEGLAGLHSKGIVHRDVKSHNVMVKPCLEIGEGGSQLALEAKLGDLGSAALVPGNGEDLLTEEAGTSGWVAPEVFSGLGYGTQADVFSLGVLIWEVFATKKPNPLNPLCGLTGQVYVDAVRDGVRPEPLPDMPIGVTDLVKRCWAFEPHQRPTAAEAALELATLAQPKG